MEVVRKVDEAREEDSGEVVVVVDNGEVVVVVDNGEVVVVDNGEVVVVVVATSVEKVEE